MQPETLPPAASSRAWAQCGFRPLDVRRFIQEVLELKDCQVELLGEAGAWSVKYGEWEARQNVKVTQGSAPRA
ncbi:MAG: hypothetical protein IPL15_10170 [Comamonadaceae bacterium]|uniref:hypothetical protein n=1 Tax=Candidatus Skiveiella danica TaxID=3386177 RepID=UPI00390A76B2|nr:hypothetical protein [Comamonadaceae bacterium]